MNLANKVTCVRLALVPVGVAFLFATHIPGNNVWALAVYILALITDMIDGQIARRLNMVTVFGSCFDGLADRLLGLTYMAYLQHAGVYPLWLFELVLARAIIFNSLYSYFTANQPKAGSWAPVRFQWILMIVSVALGVFALAVDTGQVPAFGLLPSVYHDLAYGSMVVGLLLSLVVPPRLFLHYARQVFGK